MLSVESATIAATTVQPASVGSHSFMLILGLVGGFFVFVALYDRLQRIEESDEFRQTLAVLNDAVVWSMGQTYSKLAEIEWVQTNEIIVDDEWSVSRLLRKYNWQEFEGLIAEKASVGNWSAKVTEDGSDDGIDVLVENRGKRVGIQVKRYKPDGAVSSDVVRNVVGAGVQWGLDSVIIVTTGYFTTPAYEARDEIRQQQGIDVELVEEMTSNAEGEDREDLVPLLRGTKSFEEFYPE